MQSAIPLIHVRDGGAKDGAGSFGTVIALECENDEHHGIVTELQGQAFGPEPGSFRAEAYGMLAGLRLLLQACNQGNENVNTVIHGNIPTQEICERCKNNCDYDDWWDWDCNCDNEVGECYGNDLYCNDDVDCYKDE